MSTGEPDQTKLPPASNDPAPGKAMASPKRRAADLMAGSNQESLGEFGSLDITGFGAVADAARVVREAMGQSSTGMRSSSSETLTPPPGQAAHPPKEDPHPETIHQSSRLGDISSQFGKL